MVSFASLIKRWYKIELTVIRNMGIAAVRVSMKRRYRTAGRNISICNQALVSLS